VYFRVCGEKKGEGGGVKLEGGGEEFPNKLEGNVVNLERGKSRDVLKLGKGSLIFKFELENQ
jgi:hypothetical protein